jgi:hypothetical protein
MTLVFLRRSQDNHMPEMLDIGYNSSSLHFSPQKPRPTKISGSKRRWQLFAVDKNIAVNTARMLVVPGQPPGRTAGNIGAFLGWQ